MSEASQQTLVAVGCRREKRWRSCRWSVSADRAGTGTVMKKSSNTEKIPDILRYPRLYVSQPRLYYGSRIYTSGPVLSLYVISLRPDHKSESCDSRRRRARTTTLAMLDRPTTSNSAYTSIIPPCSSQRGSEMQPR